ncbi:MAG: 4-hydroxyphenylpyruvate dioxygenase [Candidatus Melainabacteria bacterium]|nr:4-hydroxyphenylpyruvate dioxygenase [Candidatus Melainabacteria bacterium]
MKQESKATAVKQNAEIGVEQFDHVELFVGNALQACYYYHRGFGFDIVGYRGLQTGARDAASYVLRQNDIYLVITSALSPDHPVAQHVQKHGDGVKCIGLRVKDARQSYEAALNRGAQGLIEPKIQEDEDGIFISASVAAYGDTIHTFIERDNYRGGFAPGYKAVSELTAGSGLLSVDHIVGNVEVGRMDYWVDFYERVFGFHVIQRFGAKDIVTQYSALLSTVMASQNGKIKLPINEPFSAPRRSQIQEYLDYNSAPGVQHIAFCTEDIVGTVQALRKQGIEFLSVPRSYYDALTDRVGQIDEDIDLLAELGILVDRESEGYLLQIFTKPVEDRPTLFFEVIQRKGANGFGKGNFKALFESIEREQSRRGNL